MSAINDELRARVSRGAKLLDEKRPGWAGKIDPDRLAMDSCRRCILGQICGSYFQLARTFFPRVNEFGGDEIDEKRAEAHGFLFPDEEDNEGLERLTDLWHTEIQVRTDGGTP